MAKNPSKDDNQTDIGTSANGQEETTQLGTTITETTGTGDTTAAPTADTPAAPLEGDAGTAAGETTTTAAPVAPVVEPVAAAPAPTAAPAPQGVVQTDSGAATPEDKPAEAPKSALELVIDKVGIKAKLPLMHITDYMVKMAPKKPISEHDGAIQQVALFRAIVAIINNAGDDFNAAWGALLGLFHEHRAGVFAEINVFRFTEYVMLKPDERKAFLRLLNLIKLTADPKGREVGLRQANLTETLQLCLTDAGRQRVLAFYGK